jgi:hypothetical protein
MFSMTAFHSHDDDFLYEYQCQIKSLPQDRRGDRATKPAAIRRPGIRGLYYWTRGIARRVYRFIERQQEQPSDS